MHKRYTIKDISQYWKNATEYYEYNTLIYKSTEQNRARSLILKRLGV